MSHEETPRPFGMGKELTQDGAFKRQVNQFRDAVTADGSSDFPAEAGRYHLYVSWACPWAHRAAIGRHLKGLEDVISMSAVDPVRDARGWAFTGGEYTDPVNGYKFLSEAYEATQPGFDQRVTVPVLWDKQTGVIVNNESSEVLRILDSGFGELAQTKVELYPESLRTEIDAVNELIYERVNNGVYKAGFATSQTVYEAEVTTLFDTLDILDDRLRQQRWLVPNDTPTEADWRLFTTLVRFDCVYVGHFKCNLRRIVDYPNLSGYLRDLYQQPGIAELVRFQEEKDHYYKTHPMINPNGIVPLGPIMDLDAPHGRESLGA
ncbi:MAG: glutathione S-transferase family protein [Actinomycetes bacterium]